jgi:hypothetical protein
VDAHAEDEVRARRGGDLGRPGGLGLRVERDPDPETARARLLGDLRRGRARDLGVERDGVRAGGGELLEVVRRVVDHQVAVDPSARLLDPPRDGAKHDGPHRHGRDEVGVAAVEVEDAATGGEQRVDLLPEPAEVGCVE